MRPVKKPGKKLALGLAAVALAGILGVALGPRLADWVLRLRYPQAFTQVVNREAEEFGLPEELVYAVIQAESGFDPTARSRAEAMGLMQLTEGTFRWMAAEYPPENGGGDIFDANDNVHCGCALLRLLLNHYEDQEVALAAYNAGMGNVDRWLEDPACSPNGRTLEKIPFPETAAYVKKVQRGQSIYQNLYGGRPPAGGGGGARRPPTP